MTGLRLQVDTWRFWVGIAYLGIVLTIVGLYVVYVKQNREETKRLSEQRASAVQQVATCFTGVKNAPVVAGFIGGEKALITNSIDGNRAALKIKGQDPKLGDVRRASLKRLLVAKANIDILTTLIRKTTPTRKSCVQLALKTHVPYQPLLTPHRNTVRKR